MNLLRHVFLGFLVLTILRHHLDAKESQPMIHLIEKQTVEYKGLSLTWELTAVEDSLKPDGTPDGQAVHLEIDLKYGNEIKQWSLLLPPDIKPLVKKKSESISTYVGPYRLQISEARFDLQKGSSLDLSITPASDRIQNSKIVFSFVIDSISPVANPGQTDKNYSDWNLQGKVKHVYKGQLDSGPEQAFETQVAIYNGPVRKRPVGLWVNEIPKKGEVWVAFCRSEVTATRPEEILRDKAIGTSVDRFKDSESFLKK